MLTPQRTTLARDAGRVWYTCEPLCRLTQGERLPARFSSLGLHYCQFRLRSVLASYVPLSKPIYSVAPHRAQIGAQNHFSYYITRGGMLHSSPA